VNLDVCSELNRTSILSNSSVLISFLNVLFALIIVCSYMYERYMGACQCFRTCVSFWILSNKLVIHTHIVFC